MFDCDGGDLFKSVVLMERKRDDIDEQHEALDWRWQTSVDRLRLENNEARHYGGFMTPHVNGLIEATSE